MTKKTDQIYQTILQRPPDPSERKLAAEFLGPTPGAIEFERLIQALLMSNEFAFVD
jgi:hypothetical protein